MAANKTLDPSTCTTASEAFKYPLPQVKQFHRGLTAELDEKNARLRTLVGGSYRQLLGTAEMILQMREDINMVEDKLGNVGKGCGRGVIGGKAIGLGKMQGKLREGKSAEEMAWLARSRVLGMCGVVVGRLLRRGAVDDVEGETNARGKSLVLAAKVLVLSRLLAKSLTDSAVERNPHDNDLVEDSKRKLVTLRRKLLRAVERTLAKTDAQDNRDGLLQALCAYSLATSSGAKGVLRHFLLVRGDAMTLAFEDDSDSKPDTAGVLRALELYTKTLLDVQALVPRRLSEALASLKTRAMLKDDSIRQLEGLRLDVCEQWFGDEILYFTPYTRHDDLEGSQAVETLRTWAEMGSEVLLQGLGKALQVVPEFKSVVELRTHILEVWIKDGGKAKGFDPSIVLDGLRKVVNDKMLQLLASRVSKLHLVGTEIEATLGSWRPGFTDVRQSLWDEEMLEMGINNGATMFKQGVLARTHGRNDAVSRVSKGYETWRHLVNELITAIDQLKKQRWDDDLEDIEDDLALESRNNLLSTEDPQMLQERLDSSLEKAYTDLDEQIGTLLATYNNSPHIGQISVYTLRILRDIRVELPKNESLQRFGLALIPSLHEKLASTTAAESLVTFEKSFSRKQVAGRALWEGDPELPVQPSPATFKFHYNIAKAMAAVGADLWSPAAVGALKQQLRTEVGERWSRVLKSHDEDTEKANGVKTNGIITDEDEGELKETEINGHREEALDPQKRKDVLTQALFDIFVLQSSLDLTPSSEDELVKLAKFVETRLELSGPARKRLHNAAKEYWKRTGLLFGLLG